MFLDFLPLMAGILSLILCVTVLMNGASKRALKYPFAIFSGSVGVWAIFISFFRLSQHSATASAFVDIYYIAALLIACGFLLFALHYSNIKVTNIMRSAIFVPWLLMTVIMLLPGLFVKQVYLDDGLRTVILNSSLYFVYSAMFVVYSVVGLGVLWSKSGHAKKEERMRLFLAITLLICLVGGAFFNLVLPWVGIYSLISFGPLFTFLMVAAIFYAIARHGLFDIKLAVIRSMTYVLTLGTLTTLYLLVTFFIFSHLLGQGSTVDQTILNVTLTLASAFAFQPIKRFFDRWTNRLFYKDIYSADDFYGQLNQVLTSTTTLKVMLTRTARLIGTTLKAEQVHFFVHTESERSVSVGTEGYRHVPIADFEILSMFDGKILLADDDVPPEIRRIMISHRLGIVMPLRRKNTIIGFLCLGEHRNSHFTHRDLRVLKTISDELVIAIQNAASVQAVRELNEHLEQRIETATKELRASNAQLHRLDEVKDEFISMASHQLRTPLTSIKGYISMLLEGDAGKVSKEQARLLQEAFNSSERMVRLISDFLNVSRLQTGKFVVDKHPVDLVKLVQSELDALKQSALTRGHSFTFKQPKDLALVAVDENKLQQVIMNFADNALYYSKEPSVIKVSLRKIDNAVQFTIKDSGIGVPKEQQEQLFTKFFRATNARKQRPDGTGVGLFLAKKVIDAHDGEIIFASTEGKGSTFGFRLPIKD